MKTLKFPDGSTVDYELTRKPVKNVNLRVMEDGPLRISANSRVSVRHIEEFIVSQQGFILKATERIKARSAENEISDKMRWLGREYIFV